MRFIAAGRRDRKVVFEKAAVVQDGHGEEIPTWSAWCSAFAAVQFGTGAERRQAAMEQGSLAATFRVLATAKTRAVTLKDRLMLGGSAWDIEGIAPIGRTEIEFTATRSQ